MWDSATCSTPTDTLKLQCKRAGREPDRNWRRRWPGALIVGVAGVDRLASMRRADAELWRGIKLRNMLYTRVPIVCNGRNKHSITMCVLPEIAQLLICNEKAFIRKLFLQVSNGRNTVWPYEANRSYHMLAYNEGTLIQKLAVKISNGARFLCGRPGGEGSGHTWET